MIRKEEDKITEKQKEDMTVEKVKKFFGFLKQQKKYFKCAPGATLPRTKSRINSSTLNQPLISLIK